MPEGSHSGFHPGPMGEESPQLSSPLSTSDHVQDNISPDYYSVYDEPPDGEGERPVSLVSTLSSGSSHDSQSLFGSTVTLLSSTTPPIPSEEDIDLELSPAESNKKQVGNRSTPVMGRWRQQLEADVVNNQWNNNDATACRTAGGTLSHIISSPVVTDTMAPNPKLTYVDRVVMEIIETERMYVKDLSSIVEDYLAHVIDAGKLPIRPEQVCALFGNIEDIYEFNSELLQCLDMCENDPVAIAQCFVNKSEYFEIYTQYCNNYPNSVATLTDCMRIETLAKFFQDQQAALKHSLPLGSYLLKPVQRILKYHLLLQEIAKHFDPDEEGYEVVQEAIDTMTSVAWYINDMKRKHEHAVRVQEIQSLLINWKGPDLTTYGELVLEGTFPVLRAKNTRTLFLFERMLLITKKRGENYIYKIHISCSTLMLLENAKDPLLFSVIHFKRPKQPHTVQARSVEEKRLWAHHIKRLILENHNTILPQQAKDATVDNSSHAGKYQYSPERMMKAEHCHTDSFHLRGRNERRRSEPGKQIIKTTEAVLKEDQISGVELKTPAEELETCRQEENGELVAVKETLVTQASMQEVCHQGERSILLDVNGTQCPEPPTSHHIEEPQTPECLETSGETGEEEGGSDSSGLQVEETTVSVNSELSEEDEEMLSGRKSILPSSVLDQAGVLAERFISSLSRWSSLVSEDLGSPTCPSLPVDNEVFQSPSACVLDKLTQMVASPSTEPHVTSEHASCSVFSSDPREGECVSTLSKKDRLLIHKIKQYYEQAEHQDASFSVKRRESLSYIPAGLVRQLSRKINDIPQEKVGPVHRKGLCRNRPTSWSVFNLPGLENGHKPQSPVAASHGVAAEEEFRSSANMLKVWEVMEMEDESVEEKVNDSNLEFIQDNGSEISDAEIKKQPSLILEESEMSSASEGASVLSPNTSSLMVEGGSDRDSNQEDGHFSPALLPKIIRFRTSIDEDQILQDIGKMKNKVFQLARQYSQRLKNRPLVWPRSRHTANQESLQDIPGVHEEKMREMDNLNLREPMNKQEVIDEVHPPSPVQIPSSQSTTSSDSESFHWPDVQELRSKYADRSLKPTCVCAVPNRTRCNGCSQKYSSSSDLDRVQTDGCRKQLDRHFLLEGGPPHHTRSLLCRWSSLDHLFGSLSLHEVQNFQEPVRTCLPLSRVHSEGSPLQEGPNGTKSSESFRVKNLREKFQSLSTS
ncbi:pleckstrin homology domain-containing family G member 3 isoform X2 [Nothobranchius furzeri]|uniref:Pleckstrin homology domain containing, family G (With RhoGef domain) member 3 n=3 Tax=Nothobranchius furzeri TaxID=105023 RepID=A0A1A8TWU9_NOTFU